jgi:hypothetical protein
MRLIVILCSLSVVLLSCNSAKKVQVLQADIVKRDTTPVVFTNTALPVDSGVIKRDIYNKVIKNRIDFSTFSAKMRVGYNSPDGSDEATAYVRLKKDSALWLSLRGPLGIEGFRLIITKDSVKILNLLKKNVEFKGINYLQEVTGLQLDFAAIQDIVIGNPVFIDSNITSYSTNNGSSLVQMNGTVFNHLLTLDNINFRATNSMLKEFDGVQSRTCTITFSDYDQAKGVAFSTKRKILFTQPAKLDVDVDFKQYAFNEAVSFPFNVPKNYKKL